MIKAPPLATLAALVVVIVAGAALVALGHSDQAGWLSVVVLALVGTLRADQGAKTATQVHEKVNGDLEERIRGAVYDALVSTLNERSIVEEPFRPPPATKTTPAPHSPAAGRVEP